MKRFLNILLFLGLFIMSSHASIFNAQTFTLNNGLQVVVVNNPIAPLVSVAVIYKVGTADDITPGISHFLEHMMFKGTKNISAHDYTSYMARRGAHYNAHTNWDMTVYTSSIAAPYLDNVLMIEADRMHNLIFDDKEIESERQVVQEERLMRIENDPFGPATEIIQHMLFWTHPYGVHPIGLPHHIASYTKQELESHYRKWYAPNNAILVIAGSIDMETARRLVEKHFGPLPKGNPPVRKRPEEPSHKGVSLEMSYQNPRVSLTGITWYYSVPNHRSKNKELFYPLVVLDNYLTRNETSFLYRKLVLEKKLAISVYSDYPMTKFDPYPMCIKTTLAPGASVEDLRKALEEALNEVREKGISPEELERTKRDILAELIFAKDEIHGIYQIYEHMANDITLDEIEAYPDTIKKIQPEHVKAAAEFAFSQKPILKVTYFPASKDTAKETTKETAQENPSSQK